MRIMLEKWASFEQKKKRKNRVKRKIGRFLGKKKEKKIGQKKSKIYQGLYWLLALIV